MYDRENKVSEYEKYSKGFLLQPFHEHEFLDGFRHNMTKTQNKIPAKISDFI
jgi:hypothetical protein